MKKKILVVDDKKVNRKILSFILQDDYEILMAENGKECMEILKKEKTNLSAVLLDILMPVMDGYEVLQEVGKSEELSRIPFLVTTYKNVEETELRTLNLGAGDFIAKPYNSEILKKRLQNMIQMREAKETIDTLVEDSMTGLFTQEAFVRSAERIIRENPEKKYDILSVNISDLSLINDTYGYPEGTKVICYVAEGLRRVLSKEDAIVARAYADHFLVLLARGARKGKVDKIVNKMHTYVATYPGNINLRLYYGVYHVDEAESEIMAMCQRAMLTGESLKGQREVDVAYYEESVRKALVNEMFILDALDSALENEEFKVYLQPKYEASTGKMVGAEALVRWIHPERGMITPNEFVPVLEKSGGITKLDHYIWDKTAEFIENWIKCEGTYVPISVNVSRKDIFNMNLLETFMEILEKHHLEPKHMHIEITESTYAENMAELIETVHELRKQGFLIEMDDFGTAYSSLNLLAQLPLDILKLDMNFVRQIDKSEANTLIVDAIIQLAKRMELLVIAEGVEEERQARMLKDMNCDMIQGYYYAKPMPEEEFRKLLQEIVGDV